MRQRLKKKIAKKISSNIKEKFGIEIKGDMDVTEVNGRKIILVNNEPFLIEHDGEYYPTVYLILKQKPEKGRVVVDKGAVNFVMNGADVMRPGIVHADKEIKKGDFVYVTVEEKDTPIAIGIALTDGEDMIGDRGKVVRNIHHIKDRVWNHFFG
jgi:PUA domain protein